MPGLSQETAPGDLGTDGRKPSMEDLKALQRMRDQVNTIERDANRRIAEAEATAKRWEERFDALLEVMRRLPTAEDRGSYT